jgi:glycosyltransferase involved in cell wall biosynthesis
VSAREKGVLYLTFEEQWQRLLRSGHVEAIAEQYDLVLGPSTSPPPHIELLLMAKHWPGRVWTLLSNFHDAELLQALSPKLVPVPLLASSWVDPHDFTPFLGQPKEYDLVMLAHFDPVKRHWLFFNALRKLPRSFRVLLMGVPLGGRTEKDLLAEARTFGVQDRFDLLLRPSRAEVMSGLARSRVSLVFSRQEGSCIAVTESLFADTPVGLFRNARIGSKAFINEQTGVLLDRERLADELCDFVENADRFRPRSWAMRNISCHVSRIALNARLRRASREEGLDWTRDLLPIRKDLVPSYLSAQTEMEMHPWYEDFFRRYGLLLGPAARSGWLTRLGESTAPSVGVGR